MGPTTRVVVLIDMDCFYCQVEEKLNPLLKDKPVAVVQYNAWRGGGIIAVNYPARDEGVTRHMRGNEAKKKCPSINLVQVPEVRGKADLTKYRDAGQEVANVLATFTPLLQRASVDEAYLDITEAVEQRMAASLTDLNVNNLANTFVVGSELPDFVHNALTNSEFSSDNLKLAVGGLICEEMRHEVFKQTGYKCSAGIAHNKILAKLVCSLHKPNKQTILPQNAVESFFETIQISKITSLGGKFGQTLSDDFRITHMSQLAQISQKHLTQKYDEKTAHWLYNIARGVDVEPVTAKLTSKSIACCKNFAGVTALKTAEGIHQWLEKLSEELCERLEKELKENNRKAKQVVVSFAQEVNRNDVHSSRTHPLVYHQKKICSAAFEVIKKFCLRNDGSYHVKFLGLSAGHFEDVKKVREITTFFQVEQNKSQRNAKQKSVNMAKGRIADENCDPKNLECIGQLTRALEENTHELSEKNTRQVTVNRVEGSITDGNCDENKFEVVEGDIYGQLTQPLEENPHELIFYDDSCRVKCVNSEQSNNNNSLYSNYSETCDSECEDLPSKSEMILESGKPSFFTKYFDDDASASSMSVPADEDNLPESSDIIDPPNAEPLPFETCTDCQKLISVADIVSHQDYHFALKLSKAEESENIPQKLVSKTVCDKKGARSRSVKRKGDNCNSNSLMMFFKKEEQDSTAATQTCSECNKKIRIEEIAGHMDYHTAKKIHLEINSIRPSVEAMRKSSKAKSTKAKKQVSNRSVTSFFKPA